MRRSPLLITDDDREQALAALATAHTQGRIDTDALEVRTASALAATTMHALQASLDGLPVRIAEPTERVISASPLPVRTESLAVASGPMVSGSTPVVLSLAKAMVALILFGFLLLSPGLVVDGMQALAGLVRGLTEALAPAQ